MLAIGIRWTMSTDSVGRMMGLALAAISRRRLSWNALMRSLRVWVCRMALRSSVVSMSYFPLLDRAWNRLVVVTRWGLFQLFGTRRSRRGPSGNPGTGLAWR